MTSSRLLLALTLAPWLHAAYADGAMGPGATATPRWERRWPNAIASPVTRAASTATRRASICARKPRCARPSQLVAQISYCNTQLGTGYFADEEDHVAAYLKQQYYHFP